MVGLVPTIHPTARSRARGWLDPRDKPEDDSGKHLFGPEHQLRTMRLRSTPIFSVSSSTASPGENAVPDIVADMRLALAVALILAVVGEMLSGQEGLGTAILLAARAFRAPDVYASIALPDFVGLVGSYVLLLVERRVLKWRQ